MIDTEKYEGHNMHTALLDVGDDYNNWDALQDMGFNDEARLLMADSPLLLAEVERLRELYTHYYLVANHYEGDRCLENCPICYGDEEE